MKDDHKEIYLQPKCCADEYNGRSWCQDPDPEECDEGVAWTRYVRADIAEKRIAALKAKLDITERAGELSRLLGGKSKSLLGGKSKSDECFICDFLAHEYCVDCGDGYCECCCAENMEQIILTGRYVAQLRNFCISCYDKQFGDHMLEH